VWQVGEGKTTGPKLSKVANAFVLIGVLDALLKR
jgi:hypothetical protein